ncbi:putative deoxyhypusine monooxygenase [Arabidopsis thaliana]
MATIANILTLIQQNHPKARMNLRTLLDIAVEIKKVTKHNIEEEGTPSFYVTQRGGEDAVNVIVESLGVESSMIHIEAAFVFEARLRANLLGSFNTRLIAKETCMTLKPSRVLEAIKQLEAKDIMATIANILTLIQQNHPKARINLRTLLDIAVEIKKVTKHNIEEEGTPHFYVTRREAQIDSFIDTSALDESKAYQTTAATCFIHNTRESLLEETEEIYQRCLALFALMHQGGEDAVNVIVESLGVESSMIHIEAAFVFESRLRANLFC